MSTSLSELQQRLRRGLAQGESLSVINRAIDHKHLFSESDLEKFGSLKADLMRQRDAYQRGSLDREAYDLSLNELDDRLLGAINDLSAQENPMPPGPGPQPEVELVRFTRKQIILLLPGAEGPTTVIFETNWFKNWLFVKDDRYPVFDIINFFRYTKRFPFTVVGPDGKQAYRLGVKFSAMTGLMKSFMLIKEPVILMEKSI